MLFSRQWWIAAYFGIILAGAIVPPSRAATPEQIDRAIDKARDYLYSIQKDGHWEIVPEFHPTPAKPGNNNLVTESDWGGLTAMATHALLAAGEDSTNPKLKPAIDLLLKWQLRVCPYALCQRDQVLQLLPSSPTIKKVAQKDGMYLANSMRSVGEAKGLYYYYAAADATYDHSVSQYGVLAMWACGEAGFEVPAGYWDVTERAWQHHQDASGGWSYVYKGGGGLGTPCVTMTAAGVATLFITQDYVHSMEGLECKGNITNPSIDKGMKWLSDNFPSVFTAPSGVGDGLQSYALYGIERIGVAGGYKYFGTHDWYKEGADWLIKTQNPDGSWNGGGWNTNYIPATCFDLYFLTRGREPVAFNKAQYNLLERGKSAEARWNQRPRDIAKIVRWIEKKSERDLNWHVVSLKDTPVDDLQDAPILYLSGDRKLDLVPEDEAKLKLFVEDGGLILGNPDGNSKAFMDSFRALGVKLFPAGEMRTLPAEHPIYTHQELSRAGDIHHKDALLGLSNGVRELMVIPTNDWGRAWQANMFSNQDAFGLAGNIYTYAVGRTSFRHGGPGVPHPDPALKATTTVKLARLDYAGNADPEPGGWRRVAALLHNNEKIDLDIQSIKLGDGQLTQGPVSTAPAATQPTDAEIRQTAMKRLTPDQIQATGGDPVKFQALVTAKVQEVQVEVAAAKALIPAPPAHFKLAHITGTAIVTLSAAQRQELKAFIDAGGVLLIDAAGGTAAFSTAMEKELLAIFPQEATQLSAPIPDTDPFYQSGFTLPMEYRRYTKALKLRLNGPQLRGMKHNGHWAIILSHEDISNGLVGRDTDGIIGYTPESATALMVALIQKFGLNEKPAQ